jgi:hypothetical protein
VEKLDWIIGNGVKVKKVSAAVCFRKIKRSNRGGIIYMLNARLPKTNETGMSKKGLPVGIFAQVCSQLPFSLSAG